MRYFVDQKSLTDDKCIACKEPSTASLSKVVSERVQRTVNPYEIFFGYNKKSEAKVTVGFNTGHKYSLSFFLSKKSIEGPGIKVEKGQIAAYFENEVDKLYITAYDSNLKFVKEHDKFPPSIKEIRSYCDGAKIFSSTVKKDTLTTTLDKLLSSIKTDTELEDDLNKRMADIYDQFDYEFIPNPEDHKDKRVAFKQGRYRVFSDFHGDGEQRALSFLATLELSADTAIFIEEVEMFQHPRALRKLAKHIVELAKKNRIQLFINTHNYHDALRFFYYVFENEEERKDLFRCYVTTRSEGIVEAKLENNIQNIIEEVSRDST